ncbi:hypothetical protein SUDANB38_03006 [Streptomyces sp. enrichment culture]
MLRRSRVDAADGSQRGVSVKRSGAARTLAVAIIGHHLTVTDAPTPRAGQELHPYPLRPLRGLAPPSVVDTAGLEQGDNDCPDGSRRADRPGDPRGKMHCGSEASEAH